MRKFLIAVLMVALTVGFVPQATAQQVRDPQRVCRTSDGNGWSDRDVRQAIRCAVGHWSVSGGVHKALSVARCESGYDEHNTTSLSSAKGVYQFLDGTWNGVWSRHHALERRWNLQHNVFNARSNVVLAIKVAHGPGGWGPWKCA